jgi:hypothetical protein
MFNILMASNDEAWAVSIGVEASDDFPLSRYLEYTNPAIEESLKPISAETLSSLEATPALFMSELTFGDEGQYVNMRVGQIYNLRVVDGNIRFTFRLDADFGRVMVDDRAIIQAALDLGRWELTRTHWAVKSGDIDQALAALGLVRPVPTDGSTTSAFVTPAAPAAPPTPQPFADSLERFLEIVLGDGAMSGDDVFYRGHSDHRYQLEPSLFRKNAKGGYRYLRSEAVIVRELLTAHPAEFVSDPYMIDRLVRMQHYGLPTRLLDVTSNPLVGLYFCCANPKFDASGREIDGGVIVMKTKRADIKFFDSDTVSCIANLAMLEDEHKEQMKTTLGVEAFNETPEARRLLHIIAAEKPYFKPCIDPADLSRIVFIKGRVANDRISSQSGAFLLFGHEALLPETGLSSLNVQRITIRNKPAILETLRRMNIKSSTIYPGIEKTSAEIAKQYEDMA